MATSKLRKSMRTDAFTLVETVVALGILSVGILAVAASALTSLKFARESRAMTQAMYLAEDQMEVFRTTPGADVIAMGSGNDPTNPIDPDPNDDDTTEFIRRWTIAADSPEAGMITITVEVDWVDPLGITRTVQLRSMRVDT